MEDPNEQNSPPSEGKDHNDNIESVPTPNPATTAAGPKHPPPQPTGGIAKGDQEIPSLEAPDGKEKGEEEQPPPPPPPKDEKASAVEATPSQDEKASAVEATSAPPPSSTTTSTKGQAVVRNRNKRKQRTPVSSVNEDASSEHRGKRIMVAAAAAPTPQTSAITDQPNPPPPVPTIPTMAKQKNETTAAALTIAPLPQFHLTSQWEEPVDGVWQSVHSGVNVNPALSGRSGRRGSGGSVWNLGELTLYDIHRRPRRVISGRIRCDYKRLCDDFFRCVICLSTINRTKIVRECLHRFCGDCIEKSLRMGRRNECPICRACIPNRRSLAPDPGFDNLIRSILGNGNGQSSHPTGDEGEDSFEMEEETNSSASSDLDEEALTNPLQTAIHHKQQREQERFFELESNGYQDSTEDQGANGGSKGRTSQAALLDLCLRPHPDDPELDELELPYLRIRGDATVRVLLQFLQLKLFQQPDNLVGDQALQEHSPPPGSATSLMSPRLILSPTPSGRTLSEHMPLNAMAGTSVLYYRQYRKKVRDLSTKT